MVAAGSAAGVIHIVPDRVAVVGAGMVGLATAWFLQEAGVEVTVLDREGVAAGASWGNAGWLTIAGLWFLTQPVATFGSDPLNDIVFPASAPPRAGVFEMRNGQVTVKAAEGVTFQLDGKPVTTLELRGDVPGPAEADAADATPLGEDRAQRGARLCELSQRAGTARSGCRRDPRAGSAGRPAR